MQSNTGRREQAAEFSRFIVAIAVAVAITGCQPQHDESAASSDSEQAHLHWAHYGGDLHNSHYSSLDQINRSNVSTLQVAWRYDSADQRALPASSELQVNPIIVDGVLYARNPFHNVFALRADTGEELWTYTPEQEHVGLSTMRGVTYWADGEGRQARIFVATSHMLTALDATSGAPLRSFGDNGHIDLRKGLGRDPDKLVVFAPSPVICFEDLLIVGTAVNETEGAAPGTIRAFNARTGELAWRFNTIPQPGEFGYETWPEDYWRSGGGANAWAGLSLDAQRGVVYAPTGSATPDFDGQSRHGKNLFANTILALNARTGERLWHYQTVHHDLWDRDLSSAPTLATVTADGEQRDLLVQASKQGVLFLLDRDSGEPVFPIEEVPVPASTIPGQQAWLTQPRVTLPEPFTRQHFDENEITDITPEAHAHVKALYDQAASFEYYRPPGLQDTIIFPGFYGGANWGGGAYDPATNTYYINAMEDANLVRFNQVQANPNEPLGLGKLVYSEHCAGCHGDRLQGFYPYAPSLADFHSNGDRGEALRVVKRGKGRMMPFSQLSQHERAAVVDYIFALSESLASGDTRIDDDAGEQSETAYIFGGYTPFMDDRYYPAVKPPWGTLTAIDLNSGKRLWQRTLGEYAALTAEGIPPTGTRNFGGPVVTAGGLLVIAATSDEKIRIFDKANGELLWEQSLPAAGYATPSTYSVAGKQYIVIAASGGKLGTQSGDAYIAFALADE